MFIVDICLFLLFYINIVLLATESHSLYESEFEHRLLSATTQYYLYEAQREISSSDIPSFLQLVERRLREEEQRTSQCLAARTRPLVARIVEAEMLEGHLGKILGSEGSGLVALLRDKNYKEIARMYTLLARVKEGHVGMRSLVGAHVLALGDDISSDAGTPFQWYFVNADCALAVFKCPLKYTSAVVELSEVAEALLTNSLARDRDFQIVINDVRSLGVAYCVM